MNKILNVKVNNLKFNKNPLLTVQFLNLKTNQ